MGSGRGGGYTYDWIENCSAWARTAPMRSCRGSRTQDREMSSRRAVRPVMRVEVRDPERMLTIRFADGNWVWIFALAVEGRRTR